MVSLLWKLFYFSMSYDACAGHVIFIYLFLLKVCWIWEISKIKDLLLKSDVYQGLICSYPFYLHSLSTVTHEMMTFVHVDCSVYLTPIYLSVVCESTGVAGAGVKTEDFHLTGSRLTSASSIFLFLFFSSSTLCIVDFFDSLFHTF